MLLVLLLTTRIYTRSSRLLLRVNCWAAHRFCTATLGLVNVLLLNEVEVFRNDLRIVKFIIELAMLIFLQIKFFDFFKGMSFI